MLETALAAPSETQRMANIERLYREVLERMIQEELFIQAADGMSVTVSTAEVDRAIARVRAQAQLSEDQFRQAVQAQGFSITQYRSDVRRQLLRLKVLNTRARGRVNITQDQVRERYDMLVARARRTSRFNAAQLFVEVPSGASAVELADARERAERLRATLLTPEDVWDEGAMDLGWINQGDLAPALEDALMALDAGEISGAVRGPNGFHILLLVEREQAAAQVPEYEGVSNQIYQQMLEEAMTRQESIFMEELRRRASIDVRL